jgi:hypothetical protein
MNKHLVTCLKIEDFLFVLLNTIKKYYGKYVRFELKLHSFNAMAINRTSSTPENIEVKDYF